MSQTINVVSQNLIEPAVAAEESFDGTWPYEAKYSHASGFKMHFIDEGEGPETLLLLHGEPEERIIANVNDSPWFQWILKAESKGTLEQVLGQLDYNMLSTLKLNGFRRNELITNAWVRAYSAPFPSIEHAAGAIGWAKGVALGTHQFEQPSEAALTTIRSLPALCIWGAQDKTLNADHFIPLFTRLFPNSPVHLLSQASHYSPEDAPEEIARLVLRFLAKSCD